MKLRTIIPAVILVLVTLSASLAYANPYYTYNTGYSYARSPTVMVGYNSGYSYTNGHIGAYYHVDGYQLTPPSPHIARGTRAISDPTFRGHYSGFTGMYHDGYTLRPVNQYRNGYGQVGLRYRYDPSRVYYQ